ncbi:membrane protein [Anopheles sinensis]|uniref:Membrane protein n=1 Tax=Anopheles sinensis TaxID=74873 RepID=A0A084WDT5_ANOSI|nr:membrane protein [Anopheles sinensis]
MKPKPPKRPNAESRPGGHAKCKEAQPESVSRDARNAPGRHTLLHAPAGFDCDCTGNH